MYSLEEYLLLEELGLDPDWLLLLLCKQYARLQSTFSEPICCPSTIFACCPNRHGDHYSMHVRLEQIHCSARFTYVDRITISTWNSIHYTPVMLNQPSETGGRIVFKVSEIHAGESEDDLRQ